MKSDYSSLSCPTGSHYSKDSKASIMPCYSAKQLRLIQGPTTLYDKASHSLFKSLVAKDVTSLGFGLGATYDSYYSL